jgi:alpha-L-fucosidase
MNPAGFDADRICEVAKSWGARQVLLVCKHIGGFCWWQTDTTDYSVKNIPWKGGKGDLVKEVADACRRHQLKMGIYVYPDDSRYSTRYGRGGRTDDPAKQEEWNALLRRQWQEVLTICGKDLIQEIWLDGSCIVPLDDILEKLAPDAVVFQSAGATIRWVGNEAGLTKDPNWNTLAISDLKSGVATEAHSTPDGDAWGPVECDVPLYDHYWFWNPDNGKKRRSLEQLMNIYLQSAGRGSVMLLNSTPDTNGVIPEEDQTRYRELGGEIERNFGHPVARVAKVAGGEVIIPLDKPQRVNCVDLQEAYQYGHRIRRYETDARVNGIWQRVAEGTAVGRRKLDLFPDVTTDAIRVRVTAQVGEPLFREVLVHRASPALAAEFGQIPPVTRGALATASSIHGPSSDAGNLIDGKPETHWSARASDPQAWVEIDFGRPRRFAAMRATEVADHIREFQIETRNTLNQSWRAVFKGGRIGSGFKTDIPPVTARYARLRIIRIEGPAATLSELSLANRPDAWEEVSIPTLPGRAESVDIDLSQQIVDPGQFEIRLQGAEAISAVPLFEGILGDTGFLESTSASSYRLNRTQALGDGATTGIRLTFATPPDSDLKIMVRPR